MTKDQIYEKEKKSLAKLNLTPEQYEQGIKKIVEWYENNILKYYVFKKKGKQN